MSKLSKYLKGAFLSLCCFASLSLISCSNTEKEDPNKNVLGQETPEKKKWEGTINDDFTDDMVLISINKKYQDHVFTIDDFTGLELEKVECLTEYAYERYSNGDYPDNFHHIYTLTLKNKSKENVIKAIRICENLEFIDSASPNLIGSFDDPIE